MRNEKTRTGLVGAVLAVVSITLLGGCTHADRVTLEAFVTDLLRSVASALLL